MKIAFLDRDGTINEDYEDMAWNGGLFPQIKDGAINAMKYFIKTGYSIIIITNQYIIGEGIISLEDYNSFTKKLLDELALNDIEILDVFYCPHRRNDNCNCCKPNPGLIHKACDKYPDIDIKESFFVGDSISDMILAKTCGLTFYGINLDCKNPIEKLSDMINILT